MQKYLSILILHLIFLFPCGAFGETYFVTQNGSSADDGSSYANSMSVSSHNYSSFKAGDTIYLCDILISKIKVPSSGTSGNEIIYRGDYPGHPGVFKNTSSSCFYLMGNDYLIIKNMEIDAKGAEEGIVNGERIISNKIKIQGCTIHGLKNRGILMTYVSDVIIGGAPGDGNTIYNCGFDTAGGDIALGASSSDITVSYNHLYGNGVNQGVDGIVIAGPSNVTIEYNKIHDHWREDGVDVKSARDVTIRYNDIYGHHRQTGITIQVDSYDIQVYRNRVWDNGNGIWIRDGRDGGHEVENIHVWSNLIYKNQRMGLSINESGEGEPKGPFYIYNNVIAENASNATEKSHTGISISAGLKCYVKNNILFNNRHAAPSDKTRQMYVESDQISSTTLDYNQYYSIYGSVSLYWGGKDITLNQLKALGREANGDEGNPDFTDATSNRYTLDKDSECIGSGVDLGSRYAIALDPDKNYFDDIPPLVQSLNQDHYGSWERGAYVFTNSIGSPSRLEIKIIN